MLFFIFRFKGKISDEKQTLQKIYLNRGGRGLCSSPQNFMITFSFSLAWQLWGLFWTLIDWFLKLSFQALHPLIVIYRSGNFVYHHWRYNYTPIHRLMSYPFRSLISVNKNKYEHMYCSNNQLTTFYWENIIFAYSVFIIENLYP